MKTKKHEDYLVFLEEMVKIQLFYVRSLALNKPTSNFVDLVGNQTILSNFTSFNRGFIFESKIKDKGLWLNLLAKIEKSVNINDIDFEEQTLKILMPFLQERVLFDLRTLGLMQKDEEFRNGNPCTFDTFAKNENEFVELHFQNRRYPASSFDDKNEFISFIKQGIIYLRGLDIKGITISCSWQNSLPLLLTYFPKEWRDSKYFWPINEYTRNNHLGYWGQFIKADYSFNKFNGMYFRKKGKPCFAMSTCSCSLDAMEEHILALEEKNRTLEKTN